MTAYRGAAVLLSNTLVAFVLLNVVLWVASRRASPSPTLDPPAAFRTAGAFRPYEELYPWLERAEFERFMMEVFSAYVRGFRYEPFTQFREPPGRGRYVNIDPAGFRWGDPQGPWPPDPANVNVFVFGGSTTFGYGLPDGATVPAQLQAVLADPRVRVYNFGRGYYYSAQERALFVQLLAEGRVPDVAVFVDGLNEFYTPSGEPHFTPQLAEFMEGGDAPAPPPSSALRAALDALPIGRAAARVREWIGWPPPAAPAPPPAAPARPRRRLRRPKPERQVLRGVIRRWRRNKTLVARLGAAYGVRTVFVWQPVPTYGYDLAWHRHRPRGSWGAHERSRAGYPVVARLWRRGRLGDDVVWCAEIQRGLKEALYLDHVHYTPAMARRVAECIADGLRATGTLSN